MNLCTGSQGRVFKASMATVTYPDGDIRAICLAKESHCKTPVHSASTWSPFAVFKTLIRVLLSSNAVTHALDTGGHFKTCSAPWIHCVAVVSTCPHIKVEILSHPVSCLFEFFLETHNE